MSYADFLDRKAQLGGLHGFDPVAMPEFLFDFQQMLVEWALRTSEFDANHFGRIMAKLKQYPLGLTFHELATALDMEGQQVNKRLPELERVGAVIRTDETRASPSGRQCAVWKAA